LLDVQKYQIQENDTEKIKDLIKELVECGFDLYAISQTIVHFSDFKQFKAFTINCFNSMPYNYYKEVPPESFSDIKKYTKEFLLNKPIELIKEYFDEYWDNQDIINKIIDVRETKCQEHIKEIINEIEPVLDGIIIDNMALSYIDKWDFEYSRKEELETVLFGIWTPRHICKHKQMLSGDKHFKSFIDRAAKLPRK